ncbi:hypothetical protein ACRALDRAFT_2019959 [Sodiomyces alcalophilus JCM 7366]|uniref:uncharacterized protein n=1 Tax=Sodiomyces alcalophilus JCM 7366 TaxID=591952 RepID=UPI0039B49857
MKDEDEEEENKSKEGIESTYSTGYFQSHGVSQIGNISVYLLACTHQQPVMWPTFSPWKRTPLSHPFLRLSPTNHPPICAFPSPTSLFLIHHRFFSPPTITSNSQYLDIPQPDYNSSLVATRSTLRLYCIESELLSSSPLYSARISTWAGASGRSLSQTAQSHFTTLNDKN